MNSKLTLSAVFLATSLLLTQPAAAAEDVSCYTVLQQDPEVLSKDSDDGPAWSPDAIKKLRQDRAECRQRAVVARERLQAEFNIDPGKMTDSMAINRLAEELEGRRAAEQAAEFRRRDEANKRQEAAADDWAEKGASMMEQQNEMLRGMGVDPKSIPGLDEDDEEYEDDDYGSDDSDVDAMELQMYERMIAEGVAPACKGQKDQDLIDCVDEVLDAEE